MTGYIIGFGLTVLGALIGCWTKGSPYWFNWLAIGFSFALLLRGIEDDKLEGE